MNAPKKDYSHTGLYIPGTFWIIDDGTYISKEIRIITWTPFTFLLSSAFPLCPGFCLYTFKLICCMSRNPKEEHLYHMEEGLLHLKNHNAPEACLSVLTEFVWGADPQPSMHWLLLLKTRVLGIFQLLPRWEGRFIQNQ